MLYEFSLQEVTRTPLFTDQLSRFRHREREYSLERSIRHNILNSLNDCIAIENNL